jgi:hypothetical protein
MQEDWSGNASLYLGRRCATTRSISFCNPLDVLKSMIEVIRSDARVFVPHFRSGEPVSERLSGKYEHKEKGKCAESMAMYRENASRH